MEGKPPSPGIAAAGLGQIGRETNQMISLPRGL